MFVECFKIVVWNVMIEVLGSVLFICVRRLCVFTVRRFDFEVLHFCFRCIGASSDSQDKKLNENHKPILSISFIMRSVSERATIIFW
jgi:hypothetical protein